MMQIFVGLVAEGTTDYRFLMPIIEKTMMEMLYEASGQIDIYLQEIDCEKGDNFVNYVANAAQKGYENGITILIVHTDADDLEATNAYNNRILPAFNFLNTQSDTTHCKNVAAIVPVQETEAWMLADKAELIRRIGTKRSETELNINGNPEFFSNPKEKIEAAIRIGRADMPKKRRNDLTISDLYALLGQTISINSLRQLNSFSDFEQNIRRVLLALNILRTRN